MLFRTVTKYRPQRIQHYQDHSPKLQIFPITPQFAYIALSEYVDINRGSNRLAIKTSDIGFGSLCEYQHRYKWI